DLGDEALPELGQHQRRQRERGDHDREAPPVRRARPLGDGASDQRVDAAGGRRRQRAHFGVGTNSPVGRKSRGRISAKKDTMMAWAGLTQMAASDSSRLTKIEARMEPARLPMPPTTTTTKALSVKSKPIAWLMPTSGPNRTPLAAAIDAPMANTTVCTQGTGIPIASAMTRSCVGARIQMPRLPYLGNR